MKLRQEIVFWMGVLLCGILFSYIVTLVFSDQAEYISADIDSGYQVELEDGQVVDAEEFLLGALAATMPAAWELEVLKAQAVLLRTKLIKSMNGTNMVKEEETGLTVWTPVQMSQVWGNEQFSTYYKKLQQALQETRGEVLCYGDELVESLYHYASCGITRSDESGYYPYFQSVSSEADLEAEGYLKILVFSESELADLINRIDENRKVSSEGILSSIQIIQSDGSGYVIQMQIGSCLYTGLEVANALSLSSCCMSFQAYEDKIRVVGKGIGHGYGMSQWGAKKMAGKGSNYQDILLYYYSNVQLRDYYS
ncbi:MAG: SpoIID/LytB domain-containing protein [Lachnospiraceae bacterium]